MADQKSRSGPGHVATSSGPPTPELVIARLLTAMLWIAVVSAVGGGVWFLMTNGGQQVSYGSLAPPRPELTSPAAIVRDAFAGNPAAFVQLAVLTLLVTPLAREVTALYLMARRREWVFVVVAGLVTAILVWGLTGRG